MFFRVSFFGEGPPTQSHQTPGRVAVAVCRGVLQRVAVCGVGGIVGVVSPSAPVHGSIDDLDRPGSIGKESYTYMYIYAYIM